MQGGTALVFSSSGAVESSGVTTAELAHLSGVTSGLQAQIDGITGVPALTANRAVITDGSGGLAASAATSTEVSYLSGVTSSIQTQLNNVSVSNQMFLQQYFRSLQAYRISYALDGAGRLPAAPDGDSHVQLVGNAICLKRW